MERRVLWVNPLPAVQHLPNVAQKRIQLTKILDNYGFNVQVWLVASTGFLTDSYNLFATNVILPSLAFVYWPTVQNTTNESVINILTLTGSIVGQLVFGILADQYGRQKLYGVELIIVTVATLGLAQSAYGVPVLIDGTLRTSMKIVSWVEFWRFIMGIGIGAEYPLSAVITSEWASTRSRPRMLASVFIMQPLGQLFAYIIALVVLVALDRQYDLNKLSDDQLPYVIDKHWRWVTGLGTIPAIIALIFRLTIPESGRWTLDVQGDADRAVLETRSHFGDDQFGDENFGDEDLELETFDGAQDPEAPEPQAEPSPTYWEFLRNYFLVDGNWRYLAATSACWFLLDFAYYGIQINIPRLLAKLFADRNPQPPSPFPSWLSDPSFPNSNHTISKVIIENSTRAMIATSIGSLVGSVLLIILIPYISRRKFLIWSFVGLGVLLLIFGGSFLGTFEHKGYRWTLFVFVVSQFVFNLGPNSLTFIIPAEIFPTPIRCTCHGISAACGKLASVLIQCILLSSNNLAFGGKLVSSPNSNRLGYIIIIVSSAMFLGALFAWAWLPEVQETQRLPNSYVLPSKSLEELAKGRKAEDQGQVISLRRRVGGLIPKRPKLLAPREK